ncbi:mitochondrial import inner membrane translocase subunit Tim9-like [Cynocephalus volans]|uniref:mitochondrial import inner membrane translocase subunit Tim9-like n=1 Tax=Cynocephalus volans TaxID=110931 RepID=UPI002FC7A118
MTAQIPESDQIKQLKEFLGTYNKLTKTCFLDCVKDFTIREVKLEEEYHIQQTEPLTAKAGLHGQAPYRNLDERLQTAVALEMKIHLIESPESSSHHVKPSIITGQWKPLEKQNCFLLGIIKIEGFIVQ